jgi:hypothetical protein
MFGTKSKSAPKEERLYHVVVSDHIRDGSALDLAGAMTRTEALDVFTKRVARRKYSPHGPVQLRVIGEREYAALNVVSATAFLGESAR